MSVIRPFPGAHADSAQRIDGRQDLRRLTPFCAALAFLGMSLSGPAVVFGDQAGSDATTYFPLDTGNRWTYRESEYGRELEARVVSTTNGVAVYEIGTAELRLRDGGSVIEIELKGEGFVPYYLFDEDAWVHRDYWECDDGRTVTVLDRDATVTTPGGVFHDCLDIAYMTPRCADAGTLREWWAPGHGRVKWIETTIAGPVTWELHSFEPGQGVTPKSTASYFPLVEGNAWMYGCEDKWFGTDFSWAVTERQGDLVVLERPEGATHSGSVTLRDRGSEIDIELPGEGFVLFYRFVEGSSWVHRDSALCDDGYLAQAFLETEPVTTPAGTFHDCLRVERRENSPCPDAGTMVEWWAPGVGLVKWEQLNFFAGGPITLQLEEFSPRSEGPAFLRGDVDGDGSLKLADIMLTLRHVFSSQKPDIACVRSMDFDDSGRIGLLDTISMLIHVFAPGPPKPPDPFPNCGEDPTPDDLSCEETSEFCRN